VEIFFTQKQPHQATVLTTSTGAQATSTGTGTVLTAGTQQSTALIAGGTGTTGQDDLAALAKGPATNVLPGITVIPEDALSAGTIKVEIARRLRQTRTKANNERRDK
jgi:hypothetical protein